MPKTNMIVINIEKGKMKSQFLCGESKKFTVQPIFAVKKNTIIGAIDFFNNLKLIIPINSAIGGIKSIMYAKLTGRKEPGEALS